MKKNLLISSCTVCIFFISAGFADSPQDKGWNILLDQNLSQWDNYLSYHHQASYNGHVPVNEKGDTLSALGYNNDVHHVFSVIKISGEPVLKVTGEYYGCVSSKLSYRNFRLKLKVKFGTKKWEASMNKLMDAGILYYSTGPAGADYWRAWMLSQEFQIMEGHFGDYWNIANSAIDIRAFLPEGTMPAAAANDQPFFAVGTGTNHTGYCMRTADYSTPGNGWTGLELVCYEGKSLHIVNGHVVMVLSGSRYNENGIDKPLVEGKIQLQSEGCEVYYKDIKIKKIDEMPAEFLHYFIIEKKP